MRIRPDSKGHLLPRPLQFDRHNPAGERRRDQRRGRGATRHCRLPRPRKRSALGSDTGQQRGARPEAHGPIHQFAQVFIPRNKSTRGEAMSTPQDIAAAEARGEAKARAKIAEGLAELARGTDEVEMADIADLIQGDDEEPLAYSRPGDDERGGTDRPEARGGRRPRARAERSVHRPPQRPNHRRVLAVDGHR